jgi:ELWxxDGT repeat protein
LTEPWATVHGDALYFQAAAPSGDAELFRFDGTSAELVVDIVDDHDVNDPGSHPTHLTSLADKLYFFASDATSGRALWVYDGVTAALERDFNPDVLTYGTDAILGTRDESLVLLTNFDLTGYVVGGTLMLYTPGTEPIVIDTVVESAVLVGSTVVYTKAGLAYRYDGVAPVALGTLGASVDRGVALASRLFVVTAWDVYGMGSLFEVHADSLTDCLAGSSLTGVSEVVAFGEALLLSALDLGGEPYDRVHREYFGHELHRFDPTSSSIELAADVRPGWKLYCEYGG